MELIKKYFNLKKEKIYTIDEIFKLCYKGNFVAYTVGTTEEIIHYYKGYFYYNNGIILDNEMTNFYYEHPYIKFKDLAMRFMDIINVSIMIIIH